MKRIWILALCLMGCFFTACAGSEEKKEIAKTSETEVAKKTIEEKDTIIWLVSADTGILSENVKLLNDELEKMGYDFEVEFQKTEMEFGEEYEQEVKQQLEQGKADIVNIGSESSGNCTGIDQIVRKGYLESWDEYLQTENGKKLFSCYPEEVWKALQVDGTIYSLPNENMLFGDSFVAFNLKYLSEQKVREWDGTLEGLYKIVEDAKLDSSVIPIYMGQDIEELIKEKGIYLSHGVLMDPDKKEAGNPYINEKFLNMLFSVRKGYDKGLFQKTFSLVDSSAYDEEEEEKLEKKEYAVSYGSVKGSEENFYYTKIPCMQISGLSLSTGVRNNSAYKEKAFLLLTLLRTEAKLANLLIWGEEGKDFTVENGVAVRSDERDVMMAKFMTGLCDGVYADTQEPFTDRRRFRQELQEAKENQVNELLGFQIDTTGIEKELNSSYQEFQKELKSLEQGAILEKVSKIADSWEKKHGKLRKKIQKQLEHFIQ